MAADGEPGRLEPAALAKVHALYFAEDQKAAGGLVQFELLPQCGVVTGASAC